MATHLPTFPDEEYDAHLQRLREKMKNEDIDACILSSPESICWLTGLNHWVYFALHILIVPRDGEPYLVTRATEKVTFETQLGDRVQFLGHKDGDVGVDLAISVLKEVGLGNAKIGLDMSTSYRSYNPTK